MLALSRKTDYALVALAQLARNSDKQVSTRRLASGVGVPRPMLTNLLKQLLQRGYLRSTRGPNGGYQLARQPDQITLAGLIDAIEGPVRLTACCGPPETEQPPCDLTRSCPSRKAMRQVDRLLREFLQRVTLAHIVTARVESTDEEDCGRAKRQSVCALPVL